MEDPHDRAFFEQMQTRREPYRRLAECVHEAVGRQRSALDVGCGTGALTKRLAELGWSILGLDGALVLRECAEVDVLPLDLSEPSPLATRADCVICTETAEHLPESAERQIVRNVASLARRVIVWSAAQPGCEWPGHQNLKPIAHWLALFWLEGWSTDWGASRRLQGLMRRRHAQHEYCAANFHVLRRRRTMSDDAIQIDLVTDPDDEPEVLAHAVPQHLLDLEDDLGKVLAAVESVRDSGARDELSDLFRGWLERWLSAFAGEEPRATDSEREDGKSWNAIEGRWE